MNNEPIVIERIYNAPATKILHAITDKNKIIQWYFDLLEFKVELRRKFYKVKVDGSRNTPVFYPNKTLNQQEIKTIF